MLLFIHETSKNNFHIFPKAQVASNKNAHKLQHYFWAQFLHALSHDVIHFVLHVSSKNLEMEVPD